MAKADLNVSLGLVTKSFERSLNRVQRNLKSFSRELERTGSAMTQTLTVPLAAAGGAALRSAAKFEQLEKALIAVTGSSDEANAQLLRLQKIAEAPGIGFNQAVSASLQLQGLGVEAGRAEEAIRQVANVVAASGGGATQFAGVVRQLNQIQAKNRVLQEDLNILLENAPVVGGVLQEAFGAKTAEEIRALGVTGEEFFDKLVEGLSKVERVETGLFNTFENFGIQLEFTLARVGKAIDETFDIQGILNQTIRVIQRVTDVFVNLDDATRRNLLRFSALVLVSGPLLQIGSRLVNVYSGVFAVFRVGAVAVTNLVGRIELFAKGAQATGPVVSGLGKKVQTVTKAFKALSAAQQLVLGGAVAAVLTAAVALYDEYATNVRAASLATRTLNKVREEADAATEQERIAIQKIKTELNEENLSREDKNKLIERLKFINPGYFGDLDTESSKISEINAKLDDYSKLLVLVEQQKLLNTELAKTNITLDDSSRLIAESSKNISILDKIQIGLSAGLSNLSGSYGMLSKTIGSEMGEATETTRNSLETQKEAIKAQIKDIRAQIEDLGGAEVVASPPGGLDGSDDLDDIDKVTTVKVKPFFDSNIQRATFLAEAEDFSDELEKQFELDFNRGLFDTGFLDIFEAGLLDTFEPLEKVNLEMEDFSDQVERAEFVSISLGQRLRDAFGEMRDFVGPLTAAIDGTANAFGDLFSNIIDGSKNAFQAFGQALKDVLKQLVATIIKAAVLAALFTVIFPGSAQAAGGFGALFKGGISGGLNGILSLEGMYEGGVVTGPTPALIGEAGPEAVIPLDELDKMGGQQSVEVYGMVRGEDIYFSNRRAGERLSRSRG